MLTVRVEDLGDRVGYVISDSDTGGDIMTVEDRAQAAVAMELLQLERRDIVGMGVSMAMAYALIRHGDQPHGSQTIRDHIQTVVSLVDAFCGYEEQDAPRLYVVAAAALHDILEDTDCTLEEIEEQFGPDVAGFVDVLTDRPGENRYDRHLATYWRIRDKGSDAVLIKLCDRLANHSRSIGHKEHYQEMYVREYPYFKMALWRPNEHVRIWALLDGQYKRMKEIMDGTGLQEGSRVAQDARAGAT